MDKDTKRGTKNVSVRLRRMYCDMGFFVGRRKFVIIVVCEEGTMPPAPHGTPGASVWPLPIPPSPRIDAQRQTKTHVARS